MKFRTAIFTAIFAFCGLCLSVFAGPEPIPTESKEMKDVAPARAPACNWTGFYIGANAGGQFGHSEDKTAGFGYNADNQEWGYRESGFAGGGQIGFNWQWHRLVLGPEFDVGFMNLNGGGVQPGSPGGDTRGESSSDLFTTLRGRAGIALDRWLVYATGDAIGVNYDKRVLDDVNTAPAGGSLVDAHDKDFDWGYTVGGGVERMLGAHWSIKVEYLYFDLGSQGFSGVTNLGNRYDWSGETAGHIIRGGLNYHF
ncbi:MAG TPA: outer membrane beta-barrel protein [Chthoniobacterales bacterium]|jgi:outer membrane immunogenic protein